MDERTEIRNDRIAVLINSREVADDMIRAGFDREGWTVLKMEATIELADKYGIILPALRSARAYLQQIAVKRETNKDF